MLFRRRLFPECHVRVEQAAEHADIDADAVEPREYVVAADEHAQICYADVFQTTDDRRRQCRVVLGAQNRTVRQNEAHEAAEYELADEHRIGPVRKIVGFLQVAEQPSAEQRRQKHEQ